MNLQLGDVQTTALIPLAVKASESRRENPRVTDKKALEIADSPNIGACLCVGCWLEGGETAGCDCETFIRYFAERNKLFKTAWLCLPQNLLHQSYRLQ